MSNVKINPSALGLTLDDIGAGSGRKTLPTGALALIGEYRAAVNRWVDLASSPRDNGGAIVAAGRRAGDSVTALVNRHGATLSVLESVTLDGRDNGFANYPTDTDIADAIFADPNSDADAPTADAS